VNIEIKNYTLQEIELLIIRFEKQEFSKVEWTHEAHLVVAVWYSKKYNEEAALNLVRDFITRHNESVGTPNTDVEGYHETITRLWLMIVQRFLNQHSSLSVADACNKFINSATGKSNYPLTYYSEEVLFSVKARHQWVAPDKKAWEG
tara:strand:- start:5260 stop:5700 length:441 start_codon:yes stop_codon:yes gene_type:complete